MNEVKISIILPTYNVEKYIVRALNSCINQTFKDIEIIVVDDCGSDNSIKIAKEFASRDNRIKIVHNPKNLKLLKTRYIGAMKASAKYIMFLDPDDELALNTCEVILNNLKNNELLYFNTSIVLKNGTIKKNFNHENMSVNIEQLLSLKHFCFWHMCNKVYDKELYLKTFKNIKDCEVTMAEDALFCFFYFKNFEKINIINECLYFYYVNEESCLNTKNYEKIQKNFNDYMKVLSVMKANINTSYQKKMHRLLSMDFLWYIVNNKFYENIDFQNQDFFSKKQIFFLKSKEFKRKNLVKYLYFKLRYLLAKE